MRIVNARWLVDFLCGMAVTRCAMRSSRARQRVATALSLATVVLTLIAVSQPAFASSRFAPDPAGYDESFPACHGGPPAPATGTAIIGVTAGRAFTRNPCFADLFARAIQDGQSPSFYMNLNYPSGPTASRGQTGPRGTCQPSAADCRAYNYGYNAAGDADRYARSVVPNPDRWWLDVETANFWSPNTALNAQVIQGAIDYWKARGVNLGIYSIVPMWHKIAGGFAPGLRNWVARTSGAVAPPSYCSPRYAFGGGTVSLVQYWDGKYDVDMPCAGSASSAAPAPAAGSAAAPRPLTSSATGSLAGSQGGTSVFYSFAYPGGATQTITINFWPHGPDVANALFVTVVLNGSQIANLRGTDTTAPGQLTLTVSSPASVRCSSTSRTTTTRRPRPRSAIRSGLAVKLGPRGKCAEALGALRTPSASVHFPLGPGVALPR